jgi:proteasome lid subunit RPN8/RPN11
MASAMVPGIYDPGLADEDVAVTTEEARALTRRLAEDAGVLAGPSSGAALSACLRLADRIDRGVIVTIFPDAGDRYLSEDFWNDSRIRIPADVGTAMRRHAAAAYPEECCGALLGSQRGVVHEIVPLENASSAERRRRFVVTSADFLRAEAAAAASGLDLLGFYHSHPDHPAVPSQFDLDHAWPNFSYPIISVREGRPADIRSWRLSTDRSAFHEEWITWQ